MPGASRAWKGSALAASPAGTKALQRSQGRQRHFFEETSEKAAGLASQPIPYAGSMDRRHPSGHASGLAGREQA